MDERFCKWISGSCKCIKELSLDKVDGLETITIESSSLEFFRFTYIFMSYSCQLNISGQKLQYIGMEWNFSSRKHRCKSSLNVFAPNLRHFNWKGDLLNDRCLGNLPCLEKAEIFLTPEVADFDNLYQFFCSIRKVTTIVLGEKTIQVLIYCTNACFINY